MYQCMHHCAQLCLHRHILMQNYILHELLGFSFKIDHSNGGYLDLLNVANFSYSQNQTKLIFFYKSNFSYLTSQRCNERSKLRSASWLIQLWHVPSDCDSEGNIFFFGRSLKYLLFFYFSREKTGNNEGNTDVSLSPLQNGPVNWHFSCSLWMFSRKMIETSIHLCHDSRQRATKEHVSWLGETLTALNTYSCFWQFLPNLMTETLGVGGHLCSFSGRFVHTLPYRVLSVFHLPELTPCCTIGIDWASPLSINLSKLTWLPWRFFHLTDASSVHFANRPPMPKLYKRLLETIAS